MTSNKSNPSITYSNDFFENINSGSRKSAESIIPILIDYFNPHTVLDVGCGSGQWLDVFYKSGVKNVFGVDGGNAKKILIQPDCFTYCDLNKITTFKLNKRFDLTICLEVAEHLNKDIERDFIRFLCSTSDIVVFSAAVPSQGGHFHINEQWQSYWSSLFEFEGYQTLDCIRPRIWNMNEVSLWYKQNMLVYMRKNEKNYDLILSLNQKNNLIIDIIHPEMYLSKINHPHFWADPSLFPLKKLLKATFVAFIRALKKRINI
jgi:SAM-dependent methyltransferase